MKYTDAEKEALIAEANKRFPQGTRFKPVNSSTLDTNTTTIYKTYYNTAKWSNECICNNGNLYCKGVWAEVVEYPVGYKVINQDIQYEIY